MSIPQSSNLSPDEARRKAIESAKKELFGDSVAAWSLLGIVGGAAFGIGLHRQTHTEAGLNTVADFLLFAAAPAVLGGLMVGLSAYFGGKRYRWVVRSGYWLFILFNLALIGLGLSRLAHSFGLFK